MRLSSKRKMTHLVTVIGLSVSLGILADLVRHEIVQRSSAINKFGEKLGNQSPDVETFIQAVDNYLNTLTNLTGRDKVNEVKSFLEFNKGDSKNFCASWEFKNLASWDELKSYLRSVYEAVSREDAVVSLYKVIREHEKSIIHCLDFAGELYIKLNAWKKLLEMSDWINRRRLKTDLQESLEFNFIVKIAQLFHIAYITKGKGIVQTTA